MDLTIFKRNRLGLLVLIILLVAIPLTIYLVRQQQILKGRATGNSRIEFISNVDNPASSLPTATSQTIGVRLIYDPNVNPTVAPTTPPTAVPTVPVGSGVTLTVNKTTVSSGDSITVSWSGLTGLPAGDYQWSIYQSPNYSASYNTSGHLYLANCQNFIPTSLPPSSGSCNFTMTYLGGSIYDHPVFYLLHNSLLVPKTNPAGFVQTPEITITGGTE